MARGHHDAWLQEIEAIFQHVSATGTFARVVHDNSHTEDMAPVQLCTSGPSCGHHNTVECPTANVQSVFLHICKHSPLG
jgi:hypothetical protein